MSFAVNFLVPRNQIELRGKTSNLLTPAAAIVVLAAFSCVGANAACRVSSELYDRGLPNPAPPTAVDHVIVGSPESSMAAMGYARPDMAAEQNEDAAARNRRLIRTAIEHRDLETFRSLLPLDPTARQVALRDSGALGLALGNAAMPIVHQILQWEPNALAREPGKYNPLDTALHFAANTWVNNERLRRAGNPSPHAATAAEEVELFRLALDNGADPDPYAYYSPLAMLSEITATPEMLEAARLLLVHGASLERRKDRDRGMDALVVAAKGQNSEMVRLMLQLGKPSQALLDRALVSTSIVQSNGALKWLLEAGANPNVDGKAYQTLFCPQSSAANRVKYQGERDLMKLLTRFKADPNRVCMSSNSPLMVVVHDYELMKGLLDIGAAPNYVNMNGESALHLAVKPMAPFPASVNNPFLLDAQRRSLDPKVRRAAVSVLLKHGANPDLRDHQGWTPLMMTNADDEESIRLLIARGGTVNPRANSNQIQDVDLTIGPVTWALIRRNDALGRALVDASKGVGLDDCGAVYYASQAGATRTLAALLDRGAPPDLVGSPDGTTPLIAAAARGQVGTVRLLLNRRAADINETTIRDLALSEDVFPIPYFVGGETALMRAAANGHVSVVKELLHHGADPTRKDAQGRTAAEFASSREISKLLQSH
jgi:ankyrin repeat protein